MPDARVSILIEAQDRANSVLDRLRQNLGGVSGRGGVTGAAIGASKALSGIGFAVFGIQQVGHAISGLADGFFGFNSSLEQATITYGTLLGSAEEAQKRIGELQQFAALTPFNFDQVLEADRLLETFGARSIETLTLVGDAAAGTSQNFNEVAFWIGRAYSSIQAGRPFGEAAMRLQEMGILTAEGRTRLEALSEAGASSEEVWGVLNDEMGRFSGLMDDQSQSAKGLSSTLQDLGTMGTAVLTKPLFERYKRGVAALVNYLSQPRVQDGLAAGAEALEKALVRVEAQAKRVFGWFRNQGIPGLMAALKQIQPTLKIALPAAFDGFVSALENIGEWADWAWRHGIKPLADWIGNLVSSARRFVGDPNVAKIATVLGAIAGYALAARAGMTGLSLVLGTMAPLVSIVGTGLNAIANGAQVLSLLGGAGAEGILLISKAFGFLAAIPLAPIAASLSLILTVLLGFLTLNPVSLTIAAIAGAIALWDKIDWKGIGGGIVDLAVAIKDKLVAAIGKLAGIAKDPASLAGAIAGIVYDAIYGLANLPAFIVESLSKLAQNLIVKLAERISEVPYGDIKDAIVAALKAAMDALSKAPGILATAASALGSAILAAITNFPAAASKIADGLWAALSAMAKALPGALKTAAADLGNTILNALTAPLGNFAEPTRQFIKNGLLELFNKAGVVVSTAKSLGQKIISSVSDGFGLVTDMALRMATFIIGQIASLLGKAGALIVATAGAIGSKIGDWIADGLAASTSFLGRLIEIIKDKLADAWDAVPKPWDFFGGGVTAGGAASGAGAGGGMPIVVQLNFGGPTLATEAEMQRAARLLVPALRRELDRVYA